MLKYNRTIRALTDLQGRVYLYLPDSAVRKQSETGADGKRSRKCRPAGDHFFLFFRIL